MFETVSAAPLVLVRDQAGASGLVVLVVLVASTRLSPQMYCSVEM